MFKFTFYNSQLINTFRKLLLYLWPEYTVIFIELTLNAQINLLSLQSKHSYLLDQLD